MSGRDAKSPPLEVLVFGRSGFIGSFVFKTARITVGRHPDAMVRLDDPLVSLKHAELFLEAGLFRIKDLGSRTGTRVNGNPVLPRQPLIPTDEVSIGPFRLRATICEPEDAAPPHRESAPPGTDTIPTVPPLAPGAEEDELEDATIAHVRPPIPAPTPSPPPASARDTVVQSSRVRPPIPPLPIPAAGNRVQDTLAGPGPMMAAFAERAADAPPSSARPTKEKTSTARGPAPAATPQFVPAEAAPPKAHAKGPAPTPARQSAKPPPLDAENSQEAPPLAFEVSNGLLERAEESLFGDGDVLHHHDDDDDEHDEDFHPSFDLLDALSRSGLTSGGSTDAKQISLEVIHHKRGRVINVRHPRAKGPVRPIRNLAAIGAFDGGGGFALYPDASLSMTIREGGRTLSAAEVAAKVEGATLRIAPAMQASLEIGDDGLFIQWVPRAHELKAPAIAIRPTTGSIRTGALSIALHIAILAFVGLVLMGEKRQGDIDINAGRFAKIEMKELELEPPQPPEPPAPAEVATPETVSPMKLAKAQKQDHSKAPVAPKGAKATAVTQETTASAASTQKILSALGGAQGALSAISVSNLDALPVGAGDFKVSGAVGKAPGDTLRIAAAGGGQGGDTKSASELGVNNLGRIQAHAGGAVRARVTASPQAIRGEGHLDRGEIQKVVNAHLYQVQGCYERQLAKDPSLAGKVSFDWVVETSGSVSNVRIGRSSVHSVETTTCIQAAIQGWKFPAPQGGSVTVTYPFAFSALGG